LAEEKVQESETELAKKTQNPVANLIIIPLQNRMKFGIGPNSRIQNVLNVRRVVPLYRPVLRTLYCRRQREGKAGYVTSHVGFRLVWDGR
jgi:hypothetical protein